MSWYSGECYRASCLFTPLQFFCLSIDIYIYICKQWSHHCVIWQHIEYYMIVLISALVLARVACLSPSLNGMWYVTHHFSQFPFLLDCSWNCILWWKNLIPDTKLKQVGMSWKPSLTRIIMLISFLRSTEWNVPENIAITQVSHTQISTY